MSSAPPSDNELPIQDDETLSELVRTPSRTSGGLQQHADLEDDLEPVSAFAEPAPTTEKCSPNYSNECGESRSISESTSLTTGVFAATSSHGSLRDLIQAARVDWMGIDTLLTVSTQRGG
ncbi:MAG TPA: hypothetical protein VK390_07115 [Propionibacteriaceae bacterium]|nr:hypothetical protein [Propionibacteriaceae bacterium]